MHSSLIFFVYLQTQQGPSFFVSVMAGSGVGVGIGMACWGWADAEF